MVVLKAKIDGQWIPISQGFSLAAAGHVASVIHPASDSSLTLNTVTPIAGTSVTFTADPTRRYKTTISLNLAVNTAGLTAGVNIIGATGADVRALRSVNSLPINVAIPIHVEIVETGLSGTITRGLGIHTSASSVTVLGTFARNGITIVEDISTITPMGIGGTWTPVTFQNSWANVGSPYQDAQYRKIGDIVYVRGWVRNGTAGTTMFVLPAGFRPIAYQQFAAEANDKFGVIRVGPGGDVTLLIGDPLNHVSLATMAFATT